MIDKIFIPKNVTKICESAFENCNDLKLFEIPEDSNLETIERLYYSKKRFKTRRWLVFSNSKIERIIFPPHLTRICERAFANCNELHHIEFPPYSELKTIEKKKCFYFFCN